MNATPETVDLARRGLAEIVDLKEVGSLRQTLEISGATVLQFESTHPGYVGWHWSVALSGAPLGIDEMWMEPGDGALVAKQWTPWSDRIQPGDLAAGDVIPTAPDDPRLAPGYTGVDGLDEIAEPLRPQSWSLGLGRERVLSPLGLADAVDRWREGDNGPRAATARYAELPCSSCGWLVTIGGGLGQAFGVCANALSPSDGRLVAMDHGCGAHSETVVEAGVVPVTELVIDEYGYESVDRSELPEPHVEVVTEVTEVADVVDDAGVTEVTDVELDESHVEGQSNQE